jgi:[ribosomal protein S5]-alanine N-acetyltransferase
MENMPYQVSLDVQTIIRPVEEGPRPVPSDWRSGLPVLSDGRVTLRELRPSDALSLFSMLSSQEVLRFISPPPADVRGFERFIHWALAERAAGRYACFAVVPVGYDVAVGIVQVRQLDPSFSTAEWGACLGSQFWGTGVFPAAARLLLDFIFDVIGSHRLEARAAVQNGRGNGGMRKLGAVQEGVLRRSLWCQGQYHDQILWSILAEDWRQSRIELRPRVH